MPNTPDNPPVWTRVLAEEDWQFVRRFLLASGSLKDLAAEYDVSYPTIRGRLDRLIEKVRAAEDPRNEDDFRLLVRSLVIDGLLGAANARDLLREHEKALNKRKPYDGTLV